MECPHCQSEITATPHVFALGMDQDGTWQISTLRCTACDRIIANVCNADGRIFPAWPQSTMRPRLSEDVPAEYADDYHAACQVCVHSRESACALSRRLLYRLLQTEANAGNDGLADQIRRAVVGQSVPDYLKEGLRTYSRLARLDSYPEKSTHPEGLAPVEPGEAEWLLDVLQSMLELYFVLPARLQRKQTSLEEMIAPPAPAELHEGTSPGADEAGEAGTIAAAQPAVPPESWTAK